jgi:hypothetical protein
LTEKEYKARTNLVDASGIEGVFAEELAEELSRIIESFHSHSINHEGTIYASD